MRPSLLLFDIDGTLVLTGGAGKRAMLRAMSTVFGVEDGFSGVNMAGRTDTELLSGALGRIGVADTPEAHERFRETYLSFLAEEIHLPGSGRKGVMPGVRLLLDSLALQPDAHLALLTGNYREAARAKLTHFSLWSFFPWGAFGEESPDRSELARIAVARAEGQGVPLDARRRIVVIGDTPQDVAAARAIDGLAVAVATGMHTTDELAEAGADVVLSDLTDTEAVVRLLL